MAGQSGAPRAGRQGPRDVDVEIDFEIDFDFGLRGAIDAGS
jgi:hypothetical protein